MSEHRTKTQSIIEAIGLVSVVAGLIFVAIELHQGQEQMTAQTRQAITQTAIDFLSRESESNEFSDLILRGDKGEELSPAEYRRYHIHVVRMFVFWENFQYQFEAGMLEEDEYYPQLNVWRRRIAPPGVHKVWCLEKHTFSNRLVSQIEALMEEPCVE